jgi:hypothetical protein
MRRVLILLATFALVLPAASAAQVTTGSIFGSVRDASGGVVPGAEVVATNLGTNVARSATTDTEGRFSLELLPLGSYRLEAKLTGFKTYVQTGIAVEVGRNARVDPTLEPGALTEVVETRADAPLVETATAGLGRVVTQDEVLNLPLVNRNVYALLSLTAGVDRAETGQTFGYPSQTTIINGSPDAGAGAVNYYLDGGSNVGGLRNTGNLVPNPDAVQEFRVVTNSYSAEYGRFGGGAVDVITKSGTNRYQGSVFEFFRHDTLNAKRWTPGGSSLKDPLERHQYGGTFGGPLRPQKTFFFGSFSGLRQDSSVFRNTAIVPTDAQRRGDFSAFTGTIRDPLTGVAFQGNIIPESRFDPTARRILNDFIPRANLEANRFEVEETRPNDGDEFQAKIDHTLSSAHQLQASYFYSRRKDDQPLLGNGNIPWVRQQLGGNQHNLNVGDNWVISNAAVNTFRATYVRHFGFRVNTPDLALGDLGSQFRIQGPNSLPQITVSGFFNLTSAIFGPTAGSDLYMVRDVLNLTRGKHSLKFGAEVSYEKMIHDTTLNNYGVFSFNGTRSGNALADFLLGHPVTMNQDAPIVKTDNVWFFSGFAQDDWQVGSRLTINAGLRYDLQGIPVDPQNRKLTFVAGRQSRVVPTAPLGLLFPGDDGIGDGVVSADKNNFSPRIGIAWDPWGDGKTAVRGGLGIFYGSVSGNEWNQTADNQPFTIRQQFNNVFSLTEPYRNLPGGVSPYPYEYNPASPRFLAPSAIYGPSLDFVLPYSYQMNVAVQREILPSISVNVAYVGALGRKYPLSPDLNYPAVTANASTQNVDARRPILPGVLSRINLIQSIMGTDYHGLQITGEKRGRRLTTKAYYSYGKAMEDASLGESTVQGSGTTNPAQNSNNLAAERARSSTDRRHNFVASAIWNVDYFEGGGLLGALLNNWTVSTIITLRSGTGMTITAGTDRNLDGVNNDRANVSGDWRLDPDRPRSEVVNQWFNTSVFSIPTLGSDGNSARNSVDGPGLKVVDIGLFRDIKLRGRSALQLRVEATNAFNMVNLNNPSLGANTPANFGRILTARDMREIQLGVRFAF